MRYLVPLALIFLLMCAGPASAELTCIYQISDCAIGDVELFRLAQDTNSHAAVRGTTSYPIRVCCSGIQNLSWKCQNGHDVVVKLSDSTNAHIGDKTSSYTNKVCLSSDMPVDCKTISSGYCHDEPGYICIVEMSGTDNAHAAQCGSGYGYKVCCKVDVDITPPTISIAGMSKTDDTTTDDYSNSKAVWAIGLDSGTDSVSCNITWSDGAVDKALDPSITSASHTFSNDGPAVATYSCMDAHGNAADVTSPNSILIDTTVPTVGMTGLSKDDDTTADSYSSSKTVWAIGLSNGDATGSGIASCDMNWDGTWTSIGIAKASESRNYGSDGVKTAKYRCTDNAGNVNETQEYSIEIDSKAPTTTDDVHGSMTYGQQATFLLTCYDHGGSGCEKTYYCIGIGCTPTTIGNSVLVQCYQDQCQKVIRYYSVDKPQFNNVEPTKTSALINMDKRVPSCDMTPLNQPYTNESSIQLSWTGSDPQGGNLSYMVKYKVNGGADILLVGPDDITSYTFINVRDGNEYEFHCEAKSSVSHLDGGGGTTGKIMVDLGKPDLTLDPLPQWSDAGFTLTWSGTDATSGIDYYDAYWKGTAWQSLAAGTSNTQYDFDSQVTALTDGVTYSFKVFAIDEAGNTNESAVVSTLMDTEPPTCSVNPFPQSITNNPNIAVSWSGTDSASGIKSYALDVSKNGISWSLIRGHSNMAPTNTSASYAATDQGEYHFRCRATDNVGREGTTNSEHILYDTSGPDIVTDYKNLIKAFEENMTVKANITDQTPIENVTLVYNGSVVSILNKTESTYEWSDVTWLLVTDDLSFGGYSFSIEAWNTGGEYTKNTYPFYVEVCIAGETMPCGSNIGECEEGVMVCNDNNTWSDCINATYPVDEVCDGRDNNCNGELDENVNTGENLTRECGTDVGVCESGIEMCIGGPSLWGPCLGGVDFSDEICDGLDNDCDGYADEGCTCIDGETQPCGSDVGECEKGAQTCISGMWSIECVGEITPTMEICDSKDNDCDGRTDEGGVCSTDTCSNGFLDPGEEGVDCGGVCDDECGSSPTSPIGDDTWIYLIAAGVMVLIVLLLLIMYFRSKGKELTWGELTKKWSDSGY